MKKKRLVFDFETRSECDLKKSGAYKYSLDSTTRPTCLAFKISGEPAVYFLPFHSISRSWAEHNHELRKLWQRLIDEEYEFTGHNVFFERCIYENVLVRRYGWPPIPPRLYRCTAAKAASCALPRNLQGAGEAMQLITQKDPRGYQAMMGTCKPTRSYNAWMKTRADVAAAKRVGPKRMAAFHAEPPPKFLEPEAAPEVFNVLYTYCKIDVKSEEELDDALPDLTPEEQEIWHLNQTLNWRGLRFDEPTVKKIVEIMKFETEEKLGELDTLTMGLVSSPGAIKSILEFLEMEGVELPNLRAKTIGDALMNFDLPENARALLELRKSLSLTSTKKYQTFLARGVKGRVHDILLYHGASTGRDTGVGLQPHNFPRGLIKNAEGRPYSLIEDVVEYDAPMLRLLYGDDSLGLLFSAVLRNMILPEEGEKLYVADFSKIEVAVCWWLASNAPGLKILTDGGDPYKTLAAMNTGKKYQDIADDSDDRQLAKAQILGCQFGIGWRKFQSTAWDFYRLKLSDEQAQNAVYGYRKLFSAVPTLWKSYENAAIQAIEKPGEEFEAGRCTYIVENDFLWCLLPSGRKLAYKDPSIGFRDTDWGSQKTIEFWAVNSKTKKWNQERTWGGVLCENNTQAVARDLMMPSMVRLEKAGYKACLAVHDEALTSNALGSVSEFVSIMCESPAWAKGLPIEAKGWNGPRYRK